MNTTIATPDKKIVSISGDPIKSKITTTKDGKKVSGDEAIAKLATQLPDVKGYRLLCIVPEAEETYEGGIVKSADVKKIEEGATVCLFVMQLGDLAYKDKARFPEGPWCKEGDFVITRAYAGTRIKIHGKEFRIINDDTVEAVVDDPRGYERAQEISMAEIINEIPDEEEMTGGEVEVDLEVKEKLEKSTADVERVVQPKKTEAELEIEEVDDTPAADRGKDPLPEDMVETLENDTLEDYSERVKQRMAQLKKVWHDERRAKEEATREREEAVKYAQTVTDQNKKLKSTLSSGEETYLKTLIDASEKELNIAKRDYREAYESGDTDKIVEAQALMNSAQMKLSQAGALKPQHNTSQTEENSVQSNETTRPPIPRPDAKAELWQSKNTWFGKDEEMTSLALGLHEKLVRNGIDPTSDMYYLRIDETMQKRFPENFEGNSLEPEKPAQRKPSNIVAPATRSTAPKKVRLSKTQVALAKKLKLTPEHYARELLKLENANG